VTAPVYTLEEVGRRRNRERELEFEIPDFVQALTDLQFQQACNGVGPDGFPSLLRSFLTEIVWYGDLPADIHDCEFQFGKDASMAAFLAANARFYANCRKVILAERSRFNPFRYTALWRAARDREILGAEGWNAWVSAKKRYS